MVEIDVWKHGVVVAKATVDDQDAYLGESDHLGNAHWRLHSKGYAERRSGSETLLLHREIMGSPMGKMVDHVSGDKLDCRRSNLRITNSRGNSENRRGANKNSFTGVRGVSLRPSGKYRSRVGYQGTLHHVGTFDTIEEATRAAEAKRQVFGFLTGAEDPAASPAAS